MAEPISLTLPSRNPRADLYRQLADAPTEHVEALLAAYEVLQGLHDRGLLEIARGALGSSDTILEMLVQAARRPEAIRGMRNLLIVAKSLGDLEPEVLETLARALPENLARAREENPPGFFLLLRRLCSADARRALGAMTGTLVSVGQGLAARPKTPHP